MKAAQFVSMILFFLFFQLGIFILALLSFPLAPFPDLFYFLLSRCCRFLVFISFIRVGVSGVENIPGKKRLIFIGSHPGLLEPIYFIAYVPVKVFLVTDEGLARLPFLGRVLRTAGCVTYQPRQADPGFMVRLLTVLREGNSVLIFPRSLKHGQLLNEAIPRIARACGATVVPFEIKQPGEEDLAKGIYVTPGKTSIIIKPPLKGG